MEKLINILPNWITEYRTNEFKYEVINPDLLTQELMESYYGALSDTAYGLGFDSENNFEELSDNITPNTTLDELLSYVDDKISPFTKQVLDEAKSINNPKIHLSSILWYEVIINFLNDKIKDNDISELFELFTTISKCYDDDFYIGNLFEEVKEIAKGEGNLDKVKNYILIAFTKNPMVLNSSEWFDVDTLEEFAPNPTMTISNDENLIESLKDANNYLLAINYIKDHYLNNNTLDYNEYEKNALAYMVIAKLAGEVNKDDIDFDKNNLIGFNIVTNILKLENYSHIWGPIIGDIYNLKCDAVIIANDILVRNNILDQSSQLDLDYDTKSFADPALYDPAQIDPTTKKPAPKTGDLIKYIKNNLKAFELLIKQNKEFCETACQTLVKIGKKYTKWSPYAETPLKEIAKGIGVKLLDAANKEEKLKINLDMLNTALDQRQASLERLVTIYKEVSKKQKTNLNINEEDITNLPLYPKPFQVESITEYYEILKKDPILKSPIDSKLRLKSAQMIIHDIQEIVSKDEKAYPQLATLLGNFKLSNKMLATILVDRKLVNLDGSTNEEYREVYEAVKKTPRKDHKEEDIKERDEIIKNSPLTDEEKEKLDELL